MAENRVAGRLCWLVACFLLVMAQGEISRADDVQSPQVTVESWVVEVSLADKSRDVGGKSVGELFTPGAQPKSHSLVDLGLTPAQLVKHLEGAKLGRQLTKAKLRLMSGQQGSLQVNGTTIDATATVSGEKVRLDYRFDITEEVPSLRDPVTGVPGHRQRMADLAFELESGKAIMLPLLLMPGTPPKAIAVFVQATLAAAPKSTENATGQPATPRDENAQAAAAAQSPVPLAVDLKVVEVSVGKLRRRGFAWEHLAAKGPKTTPLDELFPADTAAAADPLAGNREVLQTRLIDGLLKNGLARVIAEPTLVTLNGRPASFATGTTKVDFLPILLASGRVRLECRTELTRPDASAPAADQPLRMDVAADLELGETHALGQLHLDPPSPRGTHGEVQTLILARVQRFEPRQAARK